jgi:hypothetical protein
VIGGALFAIAIVNFLVFVTLSVSWGGDALSGKVENGRYYLSHKGHLTEVTEARWWFNRAHAISVIVTHTAGIFGAGWLLSDRRRGPIKKT